MRTAGAAVAILAAATPLVAVVPATAGPTPQPLTSSFSGANAVTRIQDPGRRCADGGSGQYRHVSLEQQASPVLSAALPGVFRATLDVHHDGDEPVGTPLTGSAATAFLQGTESHATYSNQRGSVQLRLRSGTCAAPTLGFDGTTVNGTVLGGGGSTVNAGLGSVIGGNSNVGVTLPGTENSTVSGAVDGVNGITGDYSRGVAGFAIRGGELAEAVSEITIAGNLLDMFRRLEPASDLVYRFALNAPTVAVEGMTVAGR